MNTPDTQATQILVVEDENIVALDIQNRLTKIGYAVPAVCSSGEEAITKACELRPDLILMDIRLKGEMDGVTAAEMIHTKLDVPIIYVTAYADETTLQRAKITTPYGYLLKPFEERELHSTIEMALYKHRTERKIVESERWLSTTLNSIGDAVVATDVHGRINFLNSVAETLTGWSASEAMGQDLPAIMNIVDEELDSQTENPLAAAIRAGTVVNQSDHNLLTRHSTTIPIDITVAPIKDQAENRVGVVLIFRDTTERKQAEESIRQYAVELQGRNQELDAFSHTVAHNLQHPLAVIVGFADMLRKYHTTMSPLELQEYLDKFVLHGMKMSNIIDELLLLAGVRKKDDVEIKPLEMNDIVEQVKQRLTRMVDEYSADIVSPTEWPAALGYGPWVEEVLANYVSNAIKYGGELPRVVLGATSQADGMVRFWVRDNGLGLEPEDQQLLFKPFTQLGKEHGNGHGLGLSIVQRIISRLDGQVGVESDGIPGYGSTFYFTLPAASDQGSHQESYFGNGLRQTQPLASPGVV
jgi:PAS domain S-box-containing protein